MNNSDDVFLKEMKGVSPIKKNNRIKKPQAVCFSFKRYSGFL